MQPTPPAPLSLDQLPDHILVWICAFLSGQDCRRFEEVCRKFRLISHLNNDGLWRQKTKGCPTWVSSLSIAIIEDAESILQNCAVQALPWKKIYQLTELLERHYDDRMIVYRSLAHLYSPARRSEIGLFYSTYFNRRSVPSFPIRCFQVRPTIWTAPLWTHGHETNPDILRIALCSVAMQSVTVLTLDQIDLQGRSIKPWLKAMQALPLESLSWSNSAPGSENLQVFFKTLCAWPGLTRLILRGNKINDEAIESLAQELPKTAIEFLDLSENWILDKGVWALVLTLHTTAIQWLDLRENQRVLRLPGCSGEPTPGMVTRQVKISVDVAQALAKVSRFSETRRKKRLHITLDSELMCFFKPPQSQEPRETMPPRLTPSACLCM